MLAFLKRTNFRRKWLAKKAPPGPMKDFYETPYPDGAMDIHDIGFVALDLETTGLDARKHEIVSMGWVPINDLQLDLSKCVHQLVKPIGAMTEESAVVHRIFDAHLEEAPSLKDGLSRVLPVLAGKVLIAHHALVEWTFLSEACKKVFGVPFEIPTIDTLLIERRLAVRRNLDLPRGGYRLNACRQRYNLPRYGAHNALVDAIAAGELFLAQASYKSREGHVAYKEMAA